MVQLQTLLSIISKCWDTIVKSESEDYAELNPEITDLVF